MQIIIYGNENRKEELLQAGIKPGCEVLHLFTIEDIYKYPAAAAFIDLGFEEEKMKYRCI